MNKQLWGLVAISLLMAAPPARADEAEQYRFRMSKLTFSMPFELVDDRVIIEGRINGRGPYHFIFDTGGYGQISLDVAHALNLKLEGEEQSGGVGEKTVTASGVTLNDLEFGDIHITNLSIHAFDYSDNRYVFGSHPIDGVIGLPIFENAVVRIDYDKRQVTFTNPANFANPGAGQAVAFERSESTFGPMVQGSIDGVQGRFMIDTGARSTLLLAGPFVTANDLRKKYAPRIDAVTGWGIGGPVRSQVTRVKSLTLGPLAVRDVVAFLSLQKSGSLATSPYAGLVGAGVLKQFTWTFDYSRNQMLVEKSELNGKRDLYDRAGMWLAGSEDHRRFEVYDVVTGGPAAEAGIQVGDQVLAIDDQPVRDLLAVRAKLKDPATLNVKLRVHSKSGDRDVTLTLRDLT